MAQGSAQQQGNKATRQQGGEAMPTPPSARRAAINGTAGPPDPIPGAPPPQPTAAGNYSKPSAAVQSVTISVPLGEPPAGGYQTPRIDMSLRPAECEAMHRVLAGLRERHTLLDDGTSYVQSIADVVRWMMQQVAAGERAADQR